MTAELSIRIRSASANDVELLERFIAPFVESNKLLPRTAQELSTLVKNGFVAERQGVIVGCAALEIYSSKLGEIRSLAVAPEVQGQGVGKRLVDACLARAHEHNVLEVMAITSSEDFFRRCGFDFTLPDERKALFIRTRD